MKVPHVSVLDLLLICSFWGIWLNCVSVADQGDSLSSIFLFYSVLIVIFLDLPRSTFPFNSRDVKVLSVQIKKLLKIYQTRLIPSFPF